jgi:hypothetical protein
VLPEFGMAQGWPSVKYKKEMGIESCVTENLTLFTIPYRRDKPGGSPYPRARLYDAKPEAPAKESSSLRWRFRLVSYNCAR